MALQLLSNMLGAKVFLRQNNNQAESLSYQELTWNISIKNGESVILGYSFDAPDISPQLHFLGPLTFSQEIFVNQPPLSINTTSSSTASAEISPTITESIQNASSSGQSTQLLESTPSALPA